jgi:predicted dithiol-disulfide oxidoreductase (DUF899 family)
MSDAVPPTIVDQDAWLDARLAHLAEEKEFTRQRDELSRRRRELPWVEVDASYRFESADGVRTLAELFDGHSQLLVYHFMLGPGWDEGCPSCSFWADNYDGTDMHLAARDTELVAVSRAPIDEIERYRSRMGWTFAWYSSSANTFNYDLGVSFTADDIAAGSARYNFGTQPAFAEELPGLSVFNRTDDGRVYLSYQTFSRGLDMLNTTYHMLDLTPKGRDEDDLDFSMAWLRRHDTYDA